MKESFYDFKANDINGKEVSMSSYEGKVVLIVNVASGCGFTPQYEGLQKLYDEHKEEGLEILAFPCNQFGEQEKGDGEEIKNFCEKNYSITFPIFEKVEVNGNDAHPIFKFIKEQKKGFMGTESIKWNFSKFLLSKLAFEASRNKSSSAWITFSYSSTISIGLNLFEPFQALLTIFAIK